MCTDTGLSAQGSVRTKSRSAPEFLQNLLQQPFRLCDLVRPWPVLSGRAVQASRTAAIQLHTPRTAGRSPRRHVHPRHVPYPLRGSHASQPSSALICKMGLIAPALTGSRAGIKEIVSFCLLPAPHKEHEQPFVNQPRHIRAVGNTLSKNGRCARARTDTRRSLGRTIEGKGSNRNSQGPEITSGKYMYIQNAP